MEQIATASGVAVGTIYKHFPNKTDLVNAVVAASFEEVAADAENSLQRADAATAVAVTRRAMCIGSPSGLDI